MLLAALLLATSPMTAPLELNVFLHTRVELTAQRWAASCYTEATDRPECMLVAPIGPIDFAFAPSHTKPPLHFQFDLPDEGARVGVSTPGSLVRGEALGNSMVNIALSGILPGIGFAVHDQGAATGFKVAGGIVGGLGALGLVAILVSPEPQPQVTAETMSGKPIPVRALGVSGTF